MNQWFNWRMLVAFLTGAVVGTGATYIAGGKTRKERDEFKAKLEKLAPGSSGSGSAVG